MDKFVFFEKTAIVLDIGGGLSRDPQRRYSDQRMISISEQLIIRILKQIIIFASYFNFINECNSSVSSDGGDVCRGDDEAEFVSMRCVGRVEKEKYNKKGKKHANQ